MRRSLPFVLFAVAAVTALFLSAEQDRGRPGAARQNAENAAGVSAAPPGSWPPPTGNELPKREATASGAELAPRHLRQVEGGPQGSDLGVESLPPPQIGDRDAAGVHVVNVNDPTQEPQQIATGGSRSAPPIPVIAGAAAPAPPASEPAPTPDDDGASSPPPDGRSGGQLPPGDNPPPNSVKVSELPPEVQPVDTKRREDNKSFASGLTGGAGTTP